MSTETKPRIVYKLVRTDKPEDGTDVYVGSTSLSLEKRLRIDRFDATRAGRENNKLYSRMRAEGVQSWEIIPLLSRTCDKKTILELERKWCKIMGADLNTLLPITTPEEKKQQKADYYADYYKANKEAISKQKADYRKANKDAISKYQTNYYKSNKEAISKQHADYYELNKDAILKQHADYYKSIIERKRYYCDICEIVCGSNRDLQRHLKTSKHFWKYIYSVD